MSRYHEGHGAPAPALRRLGVCLLAACLLAACGGEDAPPWQASAAEEARELALEETVPVVEMSRAEFAADAEERAAGISDAYLRHYADTYGRMGFFDPDLDLRPIFAGSSSDWVGATYSPEEELITLVGEARDDTIVHEWVHALQDQHFDLIAYDVLDPTDAFLARRAVVEGDAVLAQLRFLLQQEGSDFQAVNWPATFDMWRAWSDEHLAEAGYPLIFLDYVSFVYAYGLFYTARNLLGVAPSGEAGEIDAPPPPYDFALADALFTTRPPASTQAVLELDLTGEEVVPVTGLGLAALPDAVAGRLEYVDWDALGAWYVHLLFYPLPAEDLPVSARALAAGWRGDHAAFVRDGESGAMAVIWATAWDSEQTASAVFGALWALHGGAPAGEGPGPEGTAADGESLWIEQRADRVVFIKNLAAADAVVLADEAFGPTAARALRRYPSLAATMGRLRSATGCRNVARMGALLRARGL
ncbi:MAG TPA: hypothetical protein VNM90_11625 [Haliangium sp.]|nr:hypothetical protein [Haliangium sp.]